MKYYVVSIKEKSSGKVVFMKVLVSKDILSISKMYRDFEVDFEVEEIEIKLYKDNFEYNEFLKNNKESFEIEEV